MYASEQKASAKTSFCVYRSLRVCEGRCIRFCIGALSESMYTGQTMYTHLCRKLQRKHHFAYTEAGASARGAVYASAQKPAAKASFCVYRSWGVLEGSCIRFCLGALSESMYTGKTMCTHLRRNLQRKHHFAYTEAEASARGQCIRFCAGVPRENIILRIQKPARLRGELYTHLRRKLQRKHHFAYTDAGASARGNVYASVQKPAAKTSFCVYRSQRICERHCIRFYSKTCSEIVILRTHCVASPGATFTWTTLCRQIAIPNGRLCRQRRHTRISAIRLLISMIKELNVVLIGVADKGRIIHRKADLPQRGVAT